MMMSFIKKSPSSIFSFFIPKLDPFSHGLHFSFSSSSDDQKIQTPPPKSNFITDYLITSCGFSSKQAITVSKYIAGTASSRRRDSVRHFLKHHDFTDLDIRTIISGYPSILNADVNRTMEPNLQALRSLGFAEHELRKFIARNPQSLLLRNTIPRIEFWRTFLDGDMMKLFATFTRNRSLINQDIDKNVTPKLALLKDYGLSGPQIKKLVSQSTRLFGSSISSMEVVLKRVQELGFSRGSLMFVAALRSISSGCPDLFNTKLQLFKSFGWTEGEFVAAFHRNPGILTLSEENIRQKIKFLTERAGCSQSYIASHSTLLNFSLEKRLIPRLHVVEILKSNGSIPILLNLNSIMNYTEKTFMEKIVLRYKAVVPRLHETYVAACSSKV